MTTIASITTLANATASVHGYTYATYSVTSQGQPYQVVKITKYITPPGAGTSVEFGGYGEHNTLTTAKTLALASLNANRLHRYSGSPGNSSGATVVANMHGDTLTADST